MTVKELRAALEKMPQELPVMLDFTKDDSEMFHFVAIEMVAEVGVPEKIVLLTGSNYIGEDDARLN